MGDQERVEEILGLKSVAVRVGPVGDDGRGEVELCLRPLSIKQQIALGKRSFEGGSEACLAETWESARRGGYQGSEEDLAELLEGDDLLRCEEAMWSLRPLARKRAETAQAAAQRVDPAALRMLIEMVQEKGEEDGGSQKAEVRSQKAEVRSQKAEVRSQEEEEPPEASGG